MKVMKHITIYDEAVFEIGRKYNFSVETTTKLLLEVDKLTEGELRDLDYVEDRLATHFEIISV
jgi:hypothetical protein